MARPSTVGSARIEDNFAERVAYERTRREWSYEALAQRMTDLGCPIHASGLYKIEKGVDGKGSKRRRVTLEEFVGFSLAFDIPRETLLLTPTAAGDLRLRELLDETRQAYVAIREAEAALKVRLREVADLCRDEEAGPARVADIEEQRSRHVREEMKAHREREAAPHDDADAEEDRLSAARMRSEFLGRVLGAVAGLSDAETAELEAWFAEVRPADEGVEASDE